MYSFRPTFVKVIKETEKMVVIHTIEAYIVPINTIVSKYFPNKNELIKSIYGETEIKISKKLLEKKYKEFNQEFYVYDNGYAVWTEDDKIKYKEFKEKQ
jgi:hypothetical protein